MSKEPRVCLNCGKHFIAMVTKTRIRKFCCKKCFDTYKTDRNTFKCLNCGKIFERWKSRGIRKFCCNKCSNIHRRKMIPIASKKTFYTGFICNINSGCWNWIKCKNPKGYGALSYLEKNHLAHRLSWILHNGDIPKGLFVCHRKDNPGCVNPAHLYLGTAQDNSTDMVKKGRMIRKLTDLDIIEIRKLLKLKVLIYKIAEKFKVNISTISKIKHGKTYKHVN